VSGGGGILFSMEDTPKVGERVDVRLTYEDYAALPDERGRYQLIEGDLFVTPSPSTGHQRVSRNLGLVLAAFVKEHRLGAVFYAPIDVIVSRDTVVVPDIVFLGRDRMHLVSERGIEGGPDLVVEILSPKTRRMDRITKMRLYANAGVREYWLVDPKAQTIEAFALERGAWVLRAALAEREVLTSALLPGLEIALGDVFAPDV